MFTLVFMKACTNVSLVQFYGSLSSIVNGWSCNELLTDLNGYQQLSDLIMSGLFISTTAAVCQPYCFSLILVILV